MLLHCVFRPALCLLIIHCYILSRYRVLGLKQKLLNTLYHSVELIFVSLFSFHYNWLGLRINDPSFRSGSIYVTGGMVWMGPLVCLSLFAVMFVDKSHLLRFRVSKLPCYPLLIPNKSLTHELNKFVCNLYLKVSLVMVKIYLLPVFMLLFLGSIELFRLNNKKTGDIKIRPSDHPVHYIKIRSQVHSVLLNCG